MLQHATPPATSFDDLLSGVTGHLQCEGFAVLSDIDLQAALEALEAGDAGERCLKCRILTIGSPASGAAAPCASACSVVVRETGQGVEIRVIEPGSARQGVAPAPHSLAAQVHRSLAAVLMPLEPPP